MNDPIHRRNFISRAASALLGVHAPRLFAADAKPAGNAKAKNIIYLYMDGGMSHIDTWDPKQGETAGPTKAIKTSADGIQIAEYLPRTAKQMHHGCIVRSITSTQGAHGPGNYYMHTSYEERGTILENGIRFRAIGQVDRLPIFVRTQLKRLIRESERPDTRMVLNLALSYGGRAEIIEATQQIAREVREGRLKESQITEELFSGYLGTAGQPEPDLLIRTSGELRLSNFLLWQLAYAEIYVTDVAWPDFRRPQLEEAFATFGQRERRYGKTGAQLREDSS